MLYIHFGPLKNEKELQSPDKYFDNYLYENEHLVDDEFAREVLMDIEGAKVISNYAIETKRGILASDKICGGVKAILLMKNCPEIVVNATNCGDNCAKWIQQLGREQDVTITLYYPMKFMEPFEAVCLNTGKKLKNKKQFFNAYIDWYRGDRAYLVAGLPDEIEG